MDSDSCFEDKYSDEMFTKKSLRIEINSEKRSLKNTYAEKTKANLKDQNSLQQYAN